MTAPLPAVPSPADSPAKVSLVDLKENDLKENGLPEIASFVARQSGQIPSETLARLTWLLLENPARHAGDRVPLGCGVRAANNELVGCILYLPQMFISGSMPFLVLGSSCFYVDESHRGSGGALFLKFARAANRWPLFGNSANPIAAQLWKARGATPIPDSDHELLGVIHWPPVIEELSAQSGIAQPLARATGAATAWLRHVRKLRLPLDSGTELVRLSSVEEVMELPLRDPSGIPTAQRDDSYIRWRYFSRNDPTIAVFSFRNRKAQAPAFVAVNERPRGHRGQIRSVNLLDVFPKPDSDTMAEIVAALHEKYSARTDMIVLRNLDPESQRKLQQAGFRRRNFESPNGWLLNRSAHPPTNNFHFVPADGDWII